MSLRALRISAKTAVKIRAAFHASAAIHHTVLLHWMVLHLLDRTITDQTVTHAMGFSNRYISLWNFAMQWIFSIIALFCDYADLRQESKQFKFIHKLKKFRDFFFMALVFPCTMVVSPFFWIFWIIDPRMILPEACERLIPIWVQHSVHTWIVPVVLFEIMVQPRTKPKKKLSQIVTLHGYHLFYTFVIQATYFATGHWIYAFCGNISWLQRFLFVVLICAMSQLFYALGWSLNDLLWKISPEHENTTSEEEYDGNANEKKDDYIKKKVM